MEGEIADGQEEVNNSRQEYSGTSVRTRRRHRNNTKNKIISELRIDDVDDDCIIPKNNLTSDLTSSGVNEWYFLSNVSDENCATTSNNANVNLEKRKSQSEHINLTSSLANWSQQHNITHSALDGLLKLLHPFHSFLPRDSRTLLQTPKHVNVVDCDGGSYIYFGLLFNIVEKASFGLVTQNRYPIMDAKLRENDDIFLLSITLNVDGLPVHASTTNSFWPILCILDQSINREPFIVGLYFGNSKPHSVNNYLRPFVDECIELENSGIIFSGKKYAFRVSCIVADAPARAFLKCIKSHNSLYGCEKCTQEGTYIGRTTWQYTSNLNLRNDDYFHNQQYEDHQISKTILTEIKIGLVTQVPLDYMHLVCLGVVKKIIRVWVERGPKKCKLNVIKIMQISERLLHISGNNYPSEFSRRPRSIQLFKYWKATEFRAFLLYLGPVVIHGIVSKNIYEHFLTLHCAVHILCSDLSDDREWRVYADKLLHCFVRDIPVLYGNELLVYNFHNLLHLTADVENFGKLDYFSAFPFENFMTKIKKMIRSHNHPLQQVAKRMGEFKYLPKNLQTPKIIKKKNAITKIILINGCNISINSCFNTKDGDILRIKTIREVENSDYFSLDCDCFFNKTDYYKIPIESSCLGIYKVKVNSSKKVTVCSSTLNKKCFLLPTFYDDDNVCIPFVNRNLCH